MKKTLLLSIITILFNNNIQAQKRTDVLFIFKSQLFLELSNPFNSNVNKDKNLFDSFIKQVSVKFDTLAFQNRILFLKVAPDNLKLNSVLFSGGNCSAYVMAIDTLTGVSFKLEGFDRNEFLSFFAYIKDFEFNIKTIRDFIKHYEVDGIDFQCLYEASKSEKYNPIKYPCSKRCSDLIETN